MRTNLDIGDQFGPVDVAKTLLKQYLEYIGYIFTILSALVHLL